MNKYKALLLAAGVLGAQSPVMADVIGASVEATYWQGNYSGNFISGSTDLDVENDLGFDDSGIVEIAVAVEHPVPVLPNVRLEHITIDESADGAFTATFDGVAYTGDVKTDLDLTHSDVVLYYEVLDNYVMVDVGLNVKIFDGSLVIENEADGSSSNTDIDEIIPMLFAAADVELPFTGLSVGAELSAISYSDNSLIDGKVRLRQNIGLAFAELGYRQFSLEVDDVDDIEVDAEISGAYLSLGLDF